MALNVEAAQVVINAKVTGDQAIKKLGSDINGLHGSARGVSTSFASMGRALGVIGAVATAAGTALFHGTQKALDYADAISDVSKAAGVSAEFLQELRFAGVQLGLDVAQVDALLTKLTVTLGKAKIKGDEANTAFQKLGIDPAKMRTTEEAFNTVIDQLRRIPDLAIRNALAVEIFGREAGPRLAQLVDQGSEGLNRLRDAARKSGAVLSEEFIAKASESKDKLEAMNMVIRAQFTQALVDLAPILLGIVGKFAEWSKYVGDLSRGLPKVLSEGINVQPPPEGAPRRVAAPTADEIAQINALDLMKGRKPITVNGKTFGGAGLPPPPLGGSDDGKKEEQDRERILGQYDREGQALRALTDAQIKLNQWRNEGSISAEQYSRAMEGIEAAYADLGAVEEDYSEQLRQTQEEQRQAKELEEHLGSIYEENAEFITGLSAAALEYQKRLSDINELHARGRITDEQREKSIERLDEAFSKSNNAFTAFADQAARNMQSIVAGFLRGQMAGENFGKAIINMLRDIAAEMAAQAFLTTLFNAFSPGLGTSLFGGGRAHGGPVEAGRPYLVGEAGPELVVPRSAGTVIPNNKIGGSSISVVNYVDARQATNPADIARALEANRMRTIADIAELTRRNRIGGVQ